MLIGPPLTETGFAAGIAPSGATYADPNLLFLLVLFGFCLLYVTLVAIDTTLGRVRSGDSDDAD